RGEDVSRGTSPTLPELLQGLFEAGSDPVRTLFLDHRGDLGAGNEDEVVALGELVREAPEGLPERPLDAVALDGAAHLAADRDAETDGVLLLALAREAIEHQVAGRVRRSVSIDAIELGASGEATALRRHHRDPVVGTVMPG